MNKKLIKYALPPVITAVLLLIIYAVKHIYPFGINTIDYYDMGQQIVPFYYHVYDFLHGEKGLFYDPYTALSVNMAMSTSGCSNISLFNLFFMFVKRDALLESMSFFLILKMMCMSLSMYCYVDKRFEIPNVYKTIFAVGYAFSGYVLTLYMTIQWLDIAAMFPLLMYFLGRLLKEGKYVGYIVVLALSMIASYYLTIMILMYIVLMVGVDIVAKRLFDARSCGYPLVKLLISTVISILLSMFILLPQINQTLLSARFNNESGGGLLAKYYEIVSTVKPAYTSRWWTLLGTSFAFAVIIYGIIRFRKEKKTVFITVFALFIMLSELVVEGVNLFWHFGSYVQYPIRNGFLINFTLAVAACVYIEKLCVLRSDNMNTVMDVNTVYAVIGTVAVLLVVVGIAAYNIISDKVVRSVFHYTTAVMAVLFVAYAALIIFRNGKYMRAVPVMMIAEFIVFGFIFIGKPEFTTGYTEDPEQNSEFIRICNQLDDEFEDFGIMNRVKNPDTSLNANYGLVLKRPVLSNWTHLLSPTLQRDAANMGYSVQYTRLLDAGGTVFSDALIGVDSLITCVPQDEELYTLIDTANVEIDHLTGERADYYLYESKYTLPFGVVVDNVDYDFENGDICKIYNQIYNSLGGEGEIAEYLDYKDLKIEGHKALYYLSNQVDTDDYNTTVSVNKEIIGVPSISEIDNTMYPAHFNNNALFLGAFIDEEVSLELEFESSDKNGNIIERDFEPRVISIDLDKLGELTENYNDAVIGRNASKVGYFFNVFFSDENTDIVDAFDEKLSEERYLLLPLSFDEGYYGAVNGVKSGLIPVGGMFSAVKLESVRNFVNIAFIPKGMNLGIIISVIGILALIGLILADYKYNCFAKECFALNNIYIIGFCGCLIIMYVVPYLFAAASFVK